MRFIIVAILILLPVNAAAFDEWTKEDIILQSLQTAITAVDWLQTREIAVNDDYWESNPILGKYPTTQEVDRYFLCTELLKIGFTHVLPQKYRKYWLMFWIGASGALVQHNYNMGIRINF